MNRIGNNTRAARALQIVTMSDLTTRGIRVEVQIITDGTGSVEGTGAST